MERTPHFQCPGYYFREAATAGEAMGAAVLRHRVFAEEQAIFHTLDRDEIHLIGTLSS